VKSPNKPYWGDCQGCKTRDWLDVGHLCAYCFAHMEPEARSTHIQHIMWVNAGRPADTDNPWE
jgi:hypothetical protein